MRGGLAKWQGGLWGEWGSEEGASGRVEAKKDLCVGAKAVASASCRTEEPPNPQNRRKLGKMSCTVVSKSITDRHFLSELQTHNRICTGLFE